MLTTRPKGSSTLRDLKIIYIYVVLVVFTNEGALRVFHSALIVSNGLSISFNLFSITDSMKSPSKTKRNADSDCDLSIGDDGKDWPAIFRY